MNFSNAIDDLLTLLQSLTVTPYTAMLKLLVSFVLGAIIGFDAVLDEDGTVIKEAIEAKDAVYETVIIQEAKDATTREVLNLVDEFNHRVDFNGDERGYATLYKSLHEKFGGEQV